MLSAAIAESILQAAVSARRLPPDRSITPPMKLNRPPLFFATLTTMAFLAGAGIAWQQWSSHRRTGTRPIQSGSTVESPGEKPVNDFRASSSTVSRQTAEEPVPGPRTGDFRPVLSQSSWQDPFDSDLWDSTDCTFSDDHLQLNPAGIATFLRPYRRLRIEFTASNGRAPDSETRPAAEFELQLMNRSKNIGTILTVTETEISIAHQSGRRRSLVRTAQLSPDQTQLRSGQTLHSDARFQITATGARILIWRENQMLLNCPQSPSHAGSLSVSFASRNGYLILRNMRFEGE